VDVFRIRSDGREELLASGLSSEEIDEVREWFCNTKPLGPSMKIVMRSAPTSGFSVFTAGSRPDTTEICSAEL
jgi:hypothetical protein